MYFLNRPSSSGGAAPATPILLGDGNAGVPSYSFTNYPTTGIFCTDAGNLRISFFGTESLRFTTGGAIAGSTGGGNIVLGTSGQVTLNCSGTNQNLTLTPSGTGVVLITGGTNNRLLINTGVDSGALLQIGTNTTTSAGGMVFGTDTPIFRSASGVVNFGDGTSTRAIVLNGAAANAQALIFQQAGTEVGRLWFNTDTNLKITTGAGSTTALTIDASQRATFAQYMSWAGQARVTAQFDKTSDTTLADIPGLTVNAAAGKSYNFRAYLITTANSSGGVKASIAGTATATTINYAAFTFTGSGAASSKATALGATVAAVTNSVNVIVIFGTITVNAAGTLTVQFAQNASFGTASSVLVGSFLEVNQIT